MELISFVHPMDHYGAPGTAERDRRDTHWWARMKEGGWIDWALLDLEEGEGVEIRDLIRGNENGALERVAVEYDKGLEGGRVKPDGVELRWKVTFPSHDLHGRGGLPFFCKDLTPRESRVSA